MILPSFSKCHVGFYPQLVFAMSVFTITGFAMYDFTLILYFQCQDLPSLALWLEYFDLFLVRVNSDIENIIKLRVLDAMLQKH